MRHQLLSALLLVTVVVSSLGAGVGAGVAGAADAQTTCKFPVTKTDATGAKVTINEEPKRIVTLSPSAAQTMWKIGGKDKVVGVSKYSAYLNGASEKTNVSGAGMTAVVPERVVSLNPDLVLAPNVISDETVKKLRNAGLTVYKFREAKSIDDIYAKTNLTGQLTGECGGAEKTVSWMKDRIETVHQAVEGEDSPSVMYVMSGGYTAGNGTFMDTIITQAGGTNVAAEAGISGYQPISNEVVVKQKPQWFIVSTGAKVPDAYSSTPAAKKNQTVSLNPNYVSQPAPQIVKPIAKLAKTLHPKAYQKANVTTTTEKTMTSTASDSRTTTTTAGSSTSTSESGGQPGFGIPIAVVALGLIGLLTRRF
ncbi:PGF-CTERM-anchored ABC transporter substrate-binding protein [Haladaptatus sp. AB643]|uniref:PGF-CTERM-anchored ABC transporter substrate-binding protein n=1 Tax=Haladaptatus sp. AB643 TaxID=2934174 RepID=UPI00209C0E6C|nr:PGF-CTERM-anchored ABC transporter substrate-binding protein [Haladaptatus sp. AB643]MCO8245993.1 PGF-CTERM-anchored ABC transporter substrate-binding protein [Haladaptatus sp. AB643]